jgi:ferredoxin
MANPNDKFSVNVPGLWYVDTNCIACGLCDDAVPTVFRRSEEDDHNYVYRQPESESEIKAANQALEACPMESIGNDG